MVNSPYILKHTAEEIDSKLNLIDENKNLLKYPYTGTFSEGIENVGDGSILTTKTTTSISTLELNDFLLPVGTYYINLIVTTLLDKAVDQHGFSLSVTSGGANRITGNTIIINNPEEAVVVTLNIPNSFGTDWLIKPQIAKSIDDCTHWVPNMDKIGSYVDRRFNGANAKFRQIAELMELMEYIELVEE